MGTNFYCYACAMSKFRNPGIVKFRAEIKSGDGGGAYVDFPHDVTEMFGVKGRVPIKATFDGIPYRGSLVRMGSDCHMLLILKEIRTQLGKSAGDKLDVVVELDQEERKIDLPADAQKMLSKNKTAQEFWNTLSYTHQREYAKWIEDAKRSETRTSRIEQMVSKLSRSEKP